MKMGTFKVVESGDGFWAYIQRDAGELPEASLQHVLRWMIEQLNFGHYEAIRDDSGDVVSMIIGRLAPTLSSDMDETADLIRERLAAVGIAGVCADGRRGGIDVQHSELSKKVSESITQWGERNTEFHHAFELLKVLGRLNKKTFQLVAPPIRGFAPASVLSYLDESTHCWLYGLHGASVALSRACLENALKHVLKEECQDLDDLIKSAKSRCVLDSCMVDLAHKIRKAGNRFLHEESVSEVESREVLDALRGLLEQLFQRYLP